MEKYLRNNRSEVEPLLIGRGGRVVPIAPSLQKSLSTFVDGRGLLFPGEFITSVNIATLLLYNGLSEGATICISK